MSALPQRPPTRGSKPTAPAYQPVFWQIADPSQPRIDPALIPSQSSYTPYPQSIAPSAPAVPPPPPGPRPSSSRQSVSAPGPSKKRQRTIQPAAPSPASSERSKPDPPAPPAVLVREKKQKACANCRRAKLKCIVGDDQTDCIRCMARKEKCVFYPRSLDDDWQQTMTQDVYAAMSHVSDLSSAVHHIIYHLSNQGIIPPFVTARGTPLDLYEAPDRDLPSLQGWSGEKNKEMPAPSRRRGTRAESTEPTVPKPLSHQPFRHPPFTMENPSDSWYPDGSMLPSQYPASGGQLTPTSEGLARYENGMHFNPSPATHTTPNSLPLISPALPPHPPLMPRVEPSPQGQYTGLLVPAECRLGADDPRKDVITEGMVAAEDAVVLVNYPSLFGYQLEFGHFPYLPGGPTTITPLILAVHCLLASERMPELFHYHASLAEAVKKLLMESPAGSWRSIDNVQEALVEGSLILGEDEIDPELGIGPEEIVAAAMLSLWMSDKALGAEFAATAFRYARGWIKILSDPEPRATVAELAGIVTEERVARLEERARVWLLCYLADGIATANERPFGEASRDPSDYCAQLVPLGPHRIDKRDLVLTSHARLLHILRQWQAGSMECLMSDSPVKELQRLASATDLQIDDLRRLVQTHVPDDWISVKQLDLFGAFVKVTIYSCLIGQEGLARRQRPTYVSKTVDVGVEMLERCTNWGEGSIANLPQQYLTMIFTIATAVTEYVSTAVKTNAQTGCAVTPEDVLPLLAQVIATLESAGLPQGHNIWVCVDACQRMVGQLEALCT